jgi:RecJ-like exonuclease
MDEKQICPECGGRGCKNMFGQRCSACGATGILRTAVAKKKAKKKPVKPDDWNATRRRGYEDG